MWCRAYTSLLRIIIIIIITSLLCCIIFSLLCRAVSSFFCGVGDCSPTCLLFIRSIAQIKASSGPNVWPVCCFLGTRGLAADQYRHDNHAGAGVVAAVVVVVAVVVAVGPVVLVIVIVRGGAPRDGFRLTTDQRDGALCVLFLEGLPYYIFSASVETYQVSTGGENSLAQ